MKDEMIPPGQARLTHAPADHPPVPRARKVGVLLANLGTPDGYDYWSMRRYLNEFLSDRRVIDYSAVEMAALLQTDHPDQAALHIRCELQVDLERGGRAKAR